MDSSPTTNTSSASAYSQFQSALQISEVKSSKDRVVIATSLQPTNTDSVDVGIGSLEKGLSITAREVIDRLNEILKMDLPEGIKSLKPEDLTPDKTADRIVSGATGFFDVFAKQNPDLQGEDLLNKFMEVIRGGIKEGYDDAVHTLELVGAFDFEGVKDGVEKTKSLIEDKLKAFESLKRKELGLDPVDVGSGVKAQTTAEVVKSAGGQVLNIAA